MLLRKIWFIWLVMALMGGCAMSSQKINSVKLGMLKAEVIQIMGDPNYVAAKEDIEILTYNLISDILFTDEYIVRIKNGKVDLFGKRYDFSSPY